jgi:hypothetical protein
MTRVPLHADLELATRLELAEGHSTAAAVEARASLDPSSGACWIEIAGALAMFDGVGSPLTQTFGLGLTRLPLFAGASTVPNARRQGAQQALLDARLRFAAEHGCKVAAICATPGSGSQRNAERHGFQVAYTRLKWRRDTPGSGRLA